MVSLIVGLGNPGSKYQRTRHNAGFLFLDYLHDVLGASQWQRHRQFHAEFAECYVAGKKITLIKPQTFMNLSGRAFKYWMDKEKIPMENMLVIVDELALPLGTIRLRGSGGSAGHNGLKSIEQTLLTEKYQRLRFGIGSDFPKGRQVDFVLGKWKPSEVPMVKDMLLKSVDAIECFATQGINKAMTEFNK